MLWSYSRYIFLSYFFCFNNSIEKKVGENLAYNLAENDDSVTFDYKTSNSYQNFHSIKGKIE